MADTQAGEAAPNAGPGPEAVTAPRLREFQLRRREQILKAAIDLLEDHEYEKVQIRDLADHSGVALATVYRYFSSKDHLYAAAIVEWSSLFFERVQAEGGIVGETDEERLRTMLRRTVRSLRRWPRFIRAMQILDTSPDENAQACLREFRAQYDRAFAACIHDLTPETAEDVRMVIGSVYANATRAWALGRIPIPEVELNLQQTVDLIFKPIPD